MNLELFPDFKLFCEIILILPQKPHFIMGGFGVGNLHSILLLKDVGTSQQRQCFSLFIFFFLIFFFCVLVAETAFVPSGEIRKRASS